ncbi:MAG: DUF5668 domain-containing protein [bacterium]|nr:hypothetical protein [candidate division TA06 bacterium]MDO9391385.1 DUF5668 domain-containing protein [bacterium]
MEKSTSKVLRKILWAGVFIALGVVSLLANHQVLPFAVSLKLDWPVIFIVIGLSKLIDSI